MLSGLRKKNKELKEQLLVLRKDNHRLLDETDHYIKANKAMDSSFGPPMPSSSRKRYGFDRSRSPNSSDRYQLSDRAKSIRGEASKRIDDLLKDWRDYKERAEEESRRRCRTEQNLREHLARKEREAEQLSYELASLRSLTVNQKKEIEQIAEERELESKCRARCVELELQISKMNRYIAELHVELKSRDDVLRSAEAERESLAHLNAELRQSNLEQRKKIEACEQDVTETQLELEILEEMVQALNERKTLIFNNSTRNSRSTTPNNQEKMQTTRLFPTPKASETVPPPPVTSTPIKPREKFDPIPFTLMDNTIEESIQQLTGSAQPPETTPKKHQVTLKSSSEGSSSGSSGRQVSDKRSAMSALKTLQREHVEKCSLLAEHIKKLKEENKLKEEKITHLQTKNQKTGPIA